MLKASDAAALAITRRDAAVLKYISDISWEWDLQQQASSSSTSSSDQERTGTCKHRGDSRDMHTAVLPLCSSRDTLLLLVEMLVSSS